MNLGQDFTLWGDVLFWLRLAALGACYTVPMEMDVDCLVLLPTYNEAENVEPMIEAVLGLGPRFGIMIIDDNSPDGTGRLADQWAARDDRVKVLHRDQKAGLGPAYKAGFAAGLAVPGATYLATMDGDFSHNPQDIPRLLEAVEAGADMAIGSRYIPGGGTENWGLGRRLLSRMGGIYARLMLGFKIADPTAGFNLYHRRVPEAVPIASIRTNGYGFLIELKNLVHRAGFNITEVAITFTDRAAGQSKMSPKIALEALWQIWQIRRRQSRAG